MRAVIEEHEVCEGFGRAAPAAPWLVCPLQFGASHSTVFAESCLPLSALAHIMYLMGERGSNCPSSRVLSPPTHRPVQVFSDGCFCISAVLPHEAPLGSHITTSSRDFEAWIVIERTSNYSVGPSLNASPTQLDMHEERVNLKMKTTVYRINGKPAVGREEFLLTKTNIHALGSPVTSHVSDLDG